METIRVIVSAACVYTRRLLSDQFTTKKMEGKLLKCVAFCSLFCITVLLGFSQQFRNENCFYIMISGLSFFPFFFPLENIQLIFSLNSKNPTNFKILGQCWGYNLAGRLWLFNSLRERERWWMGVFWETNRTIHPHPKLSGNMVQMRAN